MPARYRCPECGAIYIEDGKCIGCICDLLPDCLHRYSSIQEELTSDQRTIERMMRSNRGILET